LHKIATSDALHSALAKYILLVLIHVQLRIQAARAQTKTSCSLFIGHNRNCDNKLRTIQAENPSNVKNRQPAIPAWAEEQI